VATCIAGNLVGCRSRRSREGRSTPSRSGPLQRHPRQAAHMVGTVIGSRSAAWPAHPR
jgi:hypothetical protein